MSKKLEPKGKVPRVKRRDELEPTVKKKHFILGFGKAYLLIKLD